MIKEDYVGFETAKLLKEKGFDECPLYRYDDCGQLWVQGGYDKTIKWHFPATTHQMALKWLREVHNLHITIKPYITVEGILYLFEIYKLEAEKFTLIKSKTGFEKCEEATESAIKYCSENLI